MVKTKTIQVGTNGNCDVLNITAQVNEAVAESGVRDGGVIVFNVGSTAGQQFSMQFAMTPERDDRYWAYTLDAAGNVDTYFLDLTPLPCDGEIIDGDLNEDCTVDGRDFAMFADHWLEDLGIDP